MLIQFKRRFSMAHRLRFDRNSKCMTPHGHNEFVTVDLKPRAGAGAVDWGAANYAASFADMKRHWHGFIDDALDHTGIAEVLINLQSELPPFFRRCVRLAEIVHDDPEVVAAGRTKWQMYKQQGYTLRVNDLRAD